MNKLILGTVLVAMASLMAPGSAAAEVPPGLRSMGPVECDRNEEVLISDRYISTAGDAVEVHGNCELQIVDSYIEAGGVGVWVHGNGEVSVVDSYVSGARGGFQLSGNAELTCADSEVHGGVRASGNAELYRDNCQVVRGAVRWQGEEATGEDVAVREGGETVSIGPGGVIVREGGETVSVGPGGVIVREGGETVSTVETGPGGVRVDSGYSTVEVEDGYVRLQEGGTTTEISTDWRVRTRSPYSEGDTQRLIVELGGREEGGELRLDMAGDILFDFDSAAIRPQAAGQLQKAGHVIRQQSVGKIAVIGHTDSIGSDSYNKRLSEQRAVAVMGWLNANEGVPAGLMVGRGMGSKAPVAHNTNPDGSDNPDGRARNRRVEIRFGRVKSVATSAARSGAGTCAALCREWQGVDEDTANCATVVLELRGYPVVGEIVCVGVDTTEHCQLCAARLGVSDEDCAAVHRRCL